MTKHLTNVEFAATTIMGNRVIGGVAHFVSNTAPTLRADGSSLVTGDRWYKPTDNGSPGTRGDWVRDGAEWKRVIPETVVFILTPEEVDIVVDTSIMGLNAFPYAMAISSVRLDIAVAPTGSAVIVDMLKNGVSMMSTKFSIDPSEFSSTTAAAPPVLSSTSIALGDKITFKVDQRGATVPGQFLTVTIDGARI